MDKPSNTLDANQALKKLFDALQFALHPVKTTVIFLYIFKCQLDSNFDDVTFMEAYPLARLSEEVLPRHVHHLGQVKDRNGAFWVS